MNPIQIVTDSMIDLPKDMIEAHNIVVVPLTIIFDDKEYRDGIDLTNIQFYEKLSQAKELPKTSQVTPNAFMEVFKKSGAKYVIPVGEHHDGFQMYKSKISKWNAYEMGPKVDYLGELKKSVEKKGMRLGASSHRIEHWFFMSHGREFESDMFWSALSTPCRHHDIRIPVLVPGRDHDTRLWRGDEGMFRAEILAPGDFRKGFAGTHILKVFGFIVPTSGHCGQNGKK